MQVSKGQADATPASAGVVRPLRLYLRIAFGATWGLGLMMILLPKTVAFADFRLALWFMAVASPSLAGVVAARSIGRAAFADYRRRVVRIGEAWPWMIAAPALLFALHFAAAAATGSPLRPTSWTVLSASMVATSLVDPGPFEEFGWRGFLQPLLQNRFGPSAASALTGLIWGLWHLPVLVLPEFPQHDQSLPLSIVILRFLCQTIGLAVLIGFVVNRARGGVVCAMLCHWAANQGASLPLWRFDATAWTAAVCATALLLVLLQGAGLVSRGEPARQRLAADDASSVSAPPEPD